MTILPTPWMIATVITFSDMNAFNAHELANDQDGLLESCDKCNALIVNWETLNNCWITFDNKIVCKRCWANQSPLSFFGENS